MRGRKVHWTRILGLLLVPITVAGVLLWGLWNPQERLDTVTAAVVNLDEPVTIDGQLVPLGRVLAGELIGPASDTGGTSGSSEGDEQNFTWVLTDEADAQAGLDDGRYATVVTIPENFSAAATSMSGDPADVETAHIDIAESDRGRLIDSALSGIVTGTATSVLNQTLGEQFVGGVYVGFNELRSGVVEAANGAGELADGGRQLADGAAQLADGTGQLADGTGQLASGAADLAGGVGAYTAGAAQLSEAYQPLAAGATQAATQLQAIIAALGQLQVGTAQPQQDLASGLAATGAGVEGLAGDVQTLAGQCYASGATQEFCDGMVATLSARAGEIGGGAATAASGATSLGQTMANSLSALDSGGEGEDPAVQLDQLIDGLAQFGTGLSGLAAQGGQLADGAAQLADGTSELAANTPALAEGAAGIADGATQAADGASALSKGLGEAAQEIPQTTEAEREKLAETAVAPVEARGGSDELFNGSGVPLFAGLALWAGALAMSLLLAPLWPRTREAARGVGAITLRSAAPMAALGAVQGAIAGVVLPLALGYDAGQGIRFFGLAVLAGVAFALLVQGLSALLGGFGRFIAFALLVVGFAVGIVSTAPPALVAIGDASPLGSAFAGFQALASGASGAGGTALILTLWALAGLALTALAVRRARRAV